MTPKEALKELIGEYILEDSLGSYETIEQRYSGVCAVVIEALTELEELKRDVKRYFELANEEEITKEVIDEFSKIRDKLMKVGE